jgi:activator of HSP90 ATPase
MTATRSPASALHALQRRKFLALGAFAVVGAASGTSRALADPAGEVSRTGESIHQERVFAATRHRVYDALTSEAQFDRIVELSGVMKDAAMAKLKHPTRLSSHAGGAFALFGGYIVGRQLELVPDELIVQAWRVLGWPRGVYSIARFELADQAGATKLVFEHLAFPQGQAEHLAAGWQEHYWEPLTRLLA